MSARREKILALLADDPDDTFLRYSLAMDHRGDGENDRAIELFDGLIADATPHVPAFFMKGQILASDGKHDAARSVLRDGIDAARAQGDAHAAGEMSELLASLGRFGEDDADDL